MEDNKAFLAHFIEEEIYVIGDDKTPIYENESKTTTLSEPQVEQETHEKPQSVETEEVKLTLTGNSTPQVLLLVDDITQEEKVFMAKILAAIKLDLKSCALLRRPQNNSPQHTALIKDFEVNTVINFGTNIYQNARYTIDNEDSKRILCADGLNEISSNQGKKKLLWECLQKLFL